MTALRLAWLAGPKSLTPREVSSHVQTRLLGSPLLAAGPGWQDWKGVARQLSQRGRLTWAWPAGYPLAAQFAYSRALCILPHPRPSAGASTLPGGVGHGSPAAWIQPLPPTGHALSHPPAPTSQTAPSSTHALLVRPEKAAKPGPRPCSCPAQCPPTSGHALTGEDPGSAAPGTHSKVIRTLTPLPTPTLCSLLGSALINSLTLTSHPLRPQSAPASPQGLCIQPRVCHCPGFPRSGCDPPAPTLGTGSLQIQGLDLPGWPRAGWPFLLPVQTQRPLGAGKALSETAAWFGPGVDLKTCPELRLWFAGMNSAKEPSSLHPSAACGFANEASGTLAASCQGVRGQQAVGPCADTLLSPHRGDPGLGKHLPRGHLASLRENPKAGGVQEDPPHTVGTVCAPSCSVASDSLQPHGL